LIAAATSAAVLNLMRFRLAAGDGGGLGALSDAERRWS
jgi:hypothetical protein